MADTEIEKYGGLKGKELLEFLEEIKSEDEDIVEAEENAYEEIIKEEAQSLSESPENVEESPENVEIESYYGDDAWRKTSTYGQGYKPKAFLRIPEIRQRAVENSKRARREKNLRLRDDRLRIQREAFNQDFLKLDDKLEKGHVKILISALVQEHTRMIDKYSAYINKRLAALLSPFIPKALRACEKLYPDSVRKCPGFMYKASKEYGEGLLFWASPSIPYYFRQNEEQKVLLENKPKFLPSIDRAILMYHEHLKTRQEKELNYASTIVQKEIFSYFDLLKYNPFWFEILYKKLKNE